MKQYILYARFSPRPNAATCQSVVHQLEAMREFVESHGGTICGEFSDEAKSGGDRDREGLWNAVRAVRAIPGGVLLVTTADRLARDLIESENLHFQASQEGWALASLDGTLAPGDDSDPTRVLMRQIFAAVAEYQRRMGAKRTRDSIRRHLAAGRAIGSPPIGKKRQGTGTESRLVEDPDELAAVALASSLRKQGKSYQMIANELESSPYKPRGQCWHAMTVKRMLDAELE